MTLLKQNVAKLIAQIEAMEKIRVRLGVDQMDDAELVELADELKAATFSPAAILRLTGLTEKENMNNGTDET